jgi:hypothetical protein
MYEKALFRPARTFGTPQAVLEHNGLSREQKIEILRRWEYDIKEEAVAQEEGMSGRPPRHLGEIARALETLTEEDRSEKAAPTKQSGA